MDRQSDALGICRLEQRLRETLYELQRNRSVLEQTQNELLETRHALHSTSSLLETERRVSKELRVQLKTAIEIVNKLEKESIKNHVERVNHQIGHNNSEKERESLLERMNVAKMECLAQKLKIQILEESMQRKSTSNEELGNILEDLKSHMSRTVSVIESNIVKLKREHQWLQESCKSVIELNKRLQAVGLCAYAIYHKHKHEIESLRSKLAATHLTTSSTENGIASHPEIEDIRSKLTRITEELKSKQRIDTDCGKKPEISIEPQTGRESDERNEYINHCTSTNDNQAP